MANPGGFGVPPPFRWLPWLAGPLAAAALLATVDGGLPPPVDAGAVGGSIELGGSGNGTATPSGAGSLDLGGSGAAEASSAGSGSLSLGGSGVAQAVAAPAGSLSLGGSGTWTEPAAGSLLLGGTAASVAAASGSGSLQLGGTAATWTATAAGSINLGGSGAASAVPVATGSLNLGGTSAASAQPGGAGSIVLGGTGTWTTVAGGSLDLGGAGSGAAEPVAAGSLNLGGAGSPAGVGAGSGSLTLGGAGVAQAGGVGAGSLTLGGTGTGTSSASASATGSLTLGGAAVAVKLGVLKVNVGTALSPDWRNVGCGGTAAAFTTITDNFNRADSTTTLGSPWTVESQGGGGTPHWGISSNRAYPASSYVDGGGTVHSTLAYIDVAAADVDMSVTWGVTNADTGLLLRLSGTASWFQIGANRIYYVSGGSTILANFTSAFVAGDVMRVLAVGSSIKIYKNGTLLASVTDTRNLTATRHGMVGDAVFNPTLRLDDFSLASAVATTTGRLKLWDGTQWVQEACTDTRTVLDNFNRANSTTTLGTASSGPVWAASSQAGGPPVWGINSNQAYAYNPSGSTWDYAVIDTGLMDPFSLSVTITGIAGETAGLAVQYTNINNVGRLIVDTDGSVKWNHRIAGVENAFLTLAPAGSFVSGNTLGVSVVGGVVTGYINGVALSTTGTLGALPASTKHGLLDAAGFRALGSYPVRWDDFAYSPTARPLYVWTGTAWDRVACMVPA